MTKSIPVSLHTDVKPKLYLANGILTIYYKKIIPWPSKVCQG